MTPEPEVPMRRRERLRNATVTEIKDLAWVQIGESGAGSLSLRAIARDMGMTSSALYRYFAGRDQLLSAMSRDGFASLADHLEAAEAQVLSESEHTATSVRFLGVARAFRDWAREHPNEFSLAFGTPVPGYDSVEPEVKAEVMRAMSVLFRAMLDGIESDEVHPPPLVPGVAAVLGAQLAEWGANLDLGFTPEALAACLFAWTQMHGAVSLEVFNHYPPFVLPADALFEQQMHEVLGAIGCADRGDG